MDFIIGKTVQGLNNLFTKFLLREAISICTKISLVTGLLIAANKNQKNKNTISILSIIFSCAYILYFIIRTSINVIPFLKNGSTETLTTISQIANICGIIFLLLGLILTFASIFRNKKIYNKCTIAFFSIAIIGSITYSSVHLVDIKPILDKFSSLTSGLSKTSDTSKKQFNVKLRATGYGVEITNMGRDTIHNITLKTGAFEAYVSLIRAESSANVSWSDFKDDDRYPLSRIVKDKNGNIDRYIDLKCDEGSAYCHVQY